MPRLRVEVVWCAIRGPRHIVRGKRTAGSPDFSGEPALLVEAAGQLFHLFRDGLDYAFIPHRFHDAGCGACYPNYSFRILVLALPRERFSQSMSLYTAPRVGLVLPLGVATSLSRRKGSPNEPRYHFALTSEGDHCVPSHQSNPRPQALDVRFYVRSCFIIFSPHATRRAGKTLSQRL